VPDCVVEVFATRGATEHYADLAARAPAGAWTPVEDRALASLSDSVTPAGVVAVCRFLDRPVPEVVASANLVAVCADVRDPGNAGTVIRCADAAGADAVVLAGTSVDAYNPKTVRASVGSLFHLPLAAEPEVATALDAARAAGLQVLAADGAGEIDLERADDLLAGPTARLFGNEAHGLDDAALAAADHRVRIPIHGRAESLNLSTAAALCLYASARAQRT
jgi:TrmH family RNA methyltransferase